MADLKSFDRQVAEKRVDKLREEMKVHMVAQSELASAKNGRAIYQQHGNILFMTPREDAVKRLASKISSTEKELKKLEA